MSFDTNFKTQINAFSWSRVQIFLFNCKVEAKTREPKTLSKEMLGK